MKVVFFILALLGLTACGTKPQVTTSAATPTIIATRLLAEMVGELTIENECLRINGYLLVWPPDFTVDITEDMVEIKDELTGEKIVWRSGETVQVGGGEVSYVRLDEQVRQRTPAHCLQGGGALFGLWET